MRLLTDHDVYKINEVHNELQKILEKYTKKDLKTTFCVVEPHRYRIRRVDK